MSWRALLEEELPGFYCHHPLPMISRDVWVTLGDLTRSLEEAVAA